MVYCRSSLLILLQRTQCKCSKVEDVHMLIDMSCMLLVGTFVRVFVGSY